MMAYNQIKGDATLLLIANKRVASPFIFWNSQSTLKADAQACFFMHLRKLKN